ncbi:MAG: hypothetical protein QM770_05300 [Tepidisphaeraceae bacterium]
MSADENVPPGYAYHVIERSDLPALTCRVLLSKDFLPIEIPKQEVDFSTPTTLDGLFIAMANYGPLVFTVSARPAYDDGALSQWLEFLCRENKLDRGEISTIALGPLTGVTCDAMSLDDQGGPVRSKVVMVADGGRMFMIAGTGPEKLWRAGGAEIEQMLRSFQLASVTGQQPPAVPSNESSKPVKPESEERAELTDQEWRKSRSPTMRAVSIPSTR